MANRLNKILPKRIATKYRELFILMLKLHKCSASIGFIKKALHLRVTPKFVEIRGKFIDTSLKKETERSLLVQHVSKHLSEMREIRFKLDTVKDEIIQTCGYGIYKLTFTLLHSQRTIKSMNRVIHYQKQ